VVIADRQRLVQVFANLLSNAVKYNRPGGHVEVAGWREGESVHVEVVDSGLGMDSAQLARIFQPFERLGAEISGVEGTGLGLALSKQLLAAMGGEIDVSSTPERGTTFRVTLPGAA
jgi:signal transduction histidine kinase